MLRFLWRILALHMLLISCTGGAVLQDQGTESLEIIPEKPVIGILPVDYSAVDDISLTLGEAYSLTLVQLLTSLQAYDIRPLPEGYTLEELQTRNYDQLITSSVEIQKDGILHLESQVLDGRSLDSLVSMEESTSDFLALFSVAEKMVYSMVEEFYGEHLAMGSLQLDLPEGASLFIDGVYRIPDEQGGVSLMAGEHRVLVLAERPDTFYLNQDITIEEGDRRSVTVNPHSIKQFLYQGNKSPVRIDNDISDWNEIPVAMYDSVDPTSYPESMDLEWIKLDAHRDTLYLLIKTKSGYSGKDTEKFGFKVYSQDSSRYFMEAMFTHNYEEGTHQYSFFGWDHSRSADVPYSGRASRVGEYIEYSIPYSFFGSPEEIPLFMDFRSANNETTYDEINWNETYLLFTKDPTPILNGYNRFWTPGVSGAESQYRVPSGFLAADGRPDDWSEIPSLARSDSQHLPEKLSLRSVKTAMDEESLYFLIDSYNEWDRKEAVFLEWDSLSGESLLLRLENRQIIQLLDNREIPVKGTLKYGVNYLEGEIPLSHIEESAGLEPSNLMRVFSASSELKVIPYY